METQLPMRALNLFKSRLLNDPHLCSKFIFKMTTLGEAVSYFAYRNPIAQAVLSPLGLASNNKISNFIPESVSKSLWDTAGTHACFIRLAGIGGATAILMNVYGKSVIAQSNDPFVKSEGHIFFDSAQRFHLLNSVALMAVPLCHRPIITGSWLASGTILYCGATYYRAFTGNKRLCRVASYGGFLLIAAWISLLF